MNKRLLLSTALSVALATTAYAQSPSGSNTSTREKGKSTETQRTPSSESSTSQKSSPSTTTPQAQTPPSTQSTQSGSNQAPSQSKSSPSQAQRAPADEGKSGTSAPSQSAPSQAQRTPAEQGKSGASAPSQAQSPSTTTPAGNQAQTPPAGNQAQQAPSAKQPAQSGQATTQSQTNVNAAVNINDQQRTRVTQSIARLNVQAVTNVNFAVSVGTVVPTSVRLRTLPPDVVAIVPQYRGYSFFVVRDEIVIVEPRTHKIVTVLPRSGGATAAAPARSRAAFSEKDREVVRNHVRSSHAEQRTTGSTATTRTEVRRGERLPDTIVLESFPETVYRDAPLLREYRYIQRDSRTYLVDPGERTVIEEID